MTKYKVLKQFMDKNTKEIHNIGDMIYLESERGKELASKGFVEAVKVEDKPYKSKSVE